MNGNKKWVFTLVGVIVTMFLTFAAYWVGRTEALSAEHDKHVEDYNNMREKVTRLEERYSNIQESLARIEVSIHDMKKQ